SQSALLCTALGDALQLSNSPSPLRATEGHPGMEHLSPSTFHKFGEQSFLTNFDGYSGINIRNKRVDQMAYL
ncbi:unnamed protein product, partial [Cylicocyclus nassatus]